MTKQDDSAVRAEDALPMQKTSPVAFVVAGAAVLVVGGLAVFAMSGEDKQAKSETAAETEKAADAAQGMTKEELKERQEHLRRTQAAMIAAAAEEEAEERKQKQAEAQKQAAAAPAASPPPSSAPKKKPVNTKKSMDGLDALGADITSALE